MNRKHLMFLAAGVFLVLAVSFGTTYLFLRCVSCDQPASNGIIDARSYAAQLELTPEQKKKLEPLEVSLEKDLAEVQVQLADERIALCRLLEGETEDPKGLDAHADNIGTLEAQQQRIVLRHLVSVRQVLTPDQNAKLVSSLMHAICKGCRALVPHQKCVCGICNMPKE